LRNLKDDFILPQINKDYFDVYHIFNIRHAKRDLLKEYLQKNNIKTEIHYPVSPNKQQALAELFKNEQFPISEEIHNTTLSLPLSIIHSEEEIYRVVETINKF
jgi:dTDP-4-amino-4,6-dideoxygalactose transaminase